MTLAEQIYQHGFEDGLRAKGVEMTNEKALWWVNMLFRINQMEFVKNGNDAKAAEVEAAREYIVEKLGGMKDE